MILLCGGDKRSQQRDIETAKRHALETGDAAYIAKALGVVARAHGMSELAEETGLAREQLYTSLSEGGNPTLKTFLAIVHALGLEPTVKVR